MKQYYMVLPILFFSAIVLADSVVPWTWTYTKRFTSEQALQNKEKSKILFSKLSTPQFTQLIFSWNAFRPQNGYFSFHAQVRDVVTKKWYDWHTMMHWGKEEQRSFKEERTQSTNYHHVRLELPKSKKADALRIMVKAQNNANLSNIRGLHVCVSNLLNFKNELFNKKINMPSAVIENVPTISQMVLDHPKKEVLCSPTSSCMLVSNLIKKNIDPVQFAQKAYDNGLNAYGSWPFNTAHAFECANGSFYFCVQRLSAFIDLYRMLAKKIPVVVSVRGVLLGAPKEYDKGHLLIVIGWDNQNKKVICHDPAFEDIQKTRVSYDINSFLSAWERSRRLAYCGFPA
ncbi:MAG: C39 family peptidase [Candidatus Babeliales bacterium]